MNSDIEAMFGCYCFNYNHTIWKCLQLQEKNQLTIGPFMSYALQEKKQLTIWKRSKNTETKEFQSVRLYIAFLVLLTS